MLLDKASALAIVLEAAPPPREVLEVPAGEALGRVLARDAVSDMDMPAFERSAVDGWAVRAADVRAPGARLSIAGRIMAGHVPPRALGAGETMKVMTGATVPDGADAVVMVEQSREDADGGAVELLAATQPGANVSHRAEDLRTGETVLRAGTVLGAPAIGLCAMIGADPVPTWRLPRVCVIPTGDELVESHGAAPGPGQIRESNGSLLAAQVRAVVGALQPVRPGIARDSLTSLERFLDVGLDHDVLVLSGGVSMGDLDLVGRALKERGLEVLIEGVSIKPGKPLLFGRVRRGDEHCHVFGLPGNPVSSFVTFELFVRPFLLRACGVREARPLEVAARLAEGKPLKAIPRTQHVPATLHRSADGLEARPVTWHGSGDLRGLAAADGLVIVDKDQAAQPGEIVSVHVLPGREGTVRSAP